MMSRVPDIRADVRQSLQHCRLIPSDRITQLMIEEMGVAEESSEGLLKILRDNSVRTWAELTIVGSKERMIEVCGGHDIRGGVLWEAIQEYKRRAMSDSKDETGIRKSVQVDRGKILLSNSTDSNPEEEN